MAGGREMIAGGSGSLVAGRTDAICLVVSSSPRIGAKVPASSNSTELYLPVTSSPGRGMLSGILVSPLGRKRRSLFCRKRINRRLRILLARLENCRREPFLVHRIRKMLRFQAEAGMFLVDRPTLPLSLPSRKLPV